MLGRVQALPGSVVDVAFPALCSCRGVLYACGCGQADSEFVCIRHIALHPALVGGNVGIGAEGLECRCAVLRGKQLLGSRGALCEFFCHEVAFEQ